MGPCRFLLKHLFYLPHRKTRWIMSVDNVGLKTCLLGTSNSMVTLTCFPRCKPTWSRDEFNNQSHILQGRGTTSWSMVSSSFTLEITLLYIYIYSPFQNKSYVLENPWA